MPNIFYLASKEQTATRRLLSEYVLNEVGEVCGLKYLTPEESIKFILSGNFYTCMNKVKEILIPGRRFQYDLSYAEFNNPNTFFEPLLQFDGTIDELVIHAHGKPLYIQGNRSWETGWLPDDITINQIMEQKDTSGLFDNAVTIHDLEVFPEKMKKSIQAKFGPKSYCTLQCCLPFANLDRPTYPIFGVELAKFLNIPVIGSIPTIQEGNYDSGDNPQYQYSSSNMVVAHPVQGNVVVDRKLPELLN